MRYSNQFSIFFFRFHLIISILLLFSCGLSDKEKQKNSVFRANQFLTDGLCAKALNELAKVSDPYKDYYFFQVKAAAYACQSGYSDLDFFDDIDNFNSASFFNSLATFSSSSETDPDSVSFTKLALAIDTILFSVSATQNLTTDRKDHFGNEKGEDISFQSLSMILVYLGKWLYYFGSVDSDGIKGAGDGLGSGKSCVLNYPNTVAFDALLDLVTTESCTSTNGDTAGHPDLNIADPAIGVDLFAERTCRFIVYVNHMIDIISTISLSSNDSLGDMVNLKTALETLSSQADGNFEITEILGFYEQSTCLDYVKASAGNQDNIKGYFAALVESNFL